jgi:hypothetical protein
MREKLTRERFLAYVANVPQATIVLEAGSGAHHWARAIGQLGHEVRRYARGVQAPEPSLRTPLPWRPRRRASISWGFAVHNYSITLPKP